MQKSSTWQRTFGKIGCVFLPRKNRQEEGDTSSEVEKKWRRIYMWLAVLVLWKCASGNLPKPQTHVYTEKEGSWGHSNRLQPLLTQIDLNIVYFEDCWRWSDKLVETGKSGRACDVSDTFDATSWHKPLTTRLQSCIKQTWNAIITLPNRWETRMVSKCYSTTKGSNCKTWQVTPCQLLTYELSHEPDWQLSCPLWPRAGRCWQVSGNRLTSQMPNNDRDPRGKQPGEKTTSLTRKNTFQTFKIDRTSWGTINVACRIISSLHFYFPLILDITWCNL